MLIIALRVLLVGWVIAYTDTMCADQGIISDTEGAEQDITLQECQQRCLKEFSCNFIFFGIAVWGLVANRCALFETCDNPIKYTDNHPAVYRRVSSGKNTTKSFHMKKQLAFRRVCILQTFFAEKIPFIKINGRYCADDYNTTNTLDEALEECTKDDTCAVLHNEECDDKGPFRLCKHQSIVTNSSFESCAYAKQGKSIQNSCLFSWKYH